MCEYIRRRASEEVVISWKGATSTRIYPLLDIIKHSIGDDISRLGGPAFITSNTIEYYCNGVNHRSDGPAIIAKGKSELWISRGTPHREDNHSAENIYMDGKLYSVQSIHHGVKNGLVIL